MLWYPLCACAGLLLPVWGYVVKHHPNWKNYQDRLYTMIPWAIFIAFGLVLILMRIKKPTVRLLTSLLMCAALVVTGSFVYAHPSKGTIDTQGNAPTYKLVKRDNWYKISDDVIEVCDMILEESPEGARIICQYEIGAYIRQYDSRIELLFSGAQAFVKRYGGYSTYLKSDDPDMDYFMMVAEIGEVDYIVFKNISGDVKQKFLDAGCTYVGATTSGRYNIYRVK